MPSGFASAISSVLSASGGAAGGAMGGGASAVASSIAAAATPMASAGAGGGGILGGLFGGGMGGIGGMAPMLMGIALPLILGLFKKKRNDHTFALDSDYGQSGYKGYGHYEYQRRVDASFYNKRESGDFGRYKGYDNVGYKDSQLAGRYALGGIIPPSGSSSHSDRIKDLLQAEGPKGRVIVASVGERVLTAKQNDIYEQAAQSGALDLVNSGNQARFATGGVVGGGASALRRAAASPATGSGPTYTPPTSFSTQVFISGVKDMDSFRKSSSELHATQARQQRSAQRKSLG